MTLSELKTQFIALADDPDITSAQAGIWINTHYNLLCREYEWSFMVGNGTYTVASGTQETAFTGFPTPVTDFGKPLRVWISGSTGEKSLLKPIRYEERFTPGLTGCYYITPDNASIGLVPTPTNSTDVITVDYLKSLPDMADGDTPIFLSDFHWILIYKPLVIYQKQQREASDEFEAPYRELLRAMISFYNLPQAASTAMLQRGASGSRFEYPF